MLVDRHPQVVQNHFVSKSVLPKSGRATIVIALEVLLGILGQNFKKYSAEE